MFSHLKIYGKIERPLKLLITAEFFIQLVNATFMNLQTLYMTAEHYNKTDIADFISWRFAGVLALTIPLGLFIRGKKVKHFFFISSIGVPLFASMIVYAVHTHNSTFLIVSQLLWGASFTFMQIPVLPFILRHASLETQTPAISLSYSTWSFAGILSAILVYIFSAINPDFFSEGVMLFGISIFSFAGCICLLKMDIEEKPAVVSEEKTAMNPQDWKLIGYATIPALIIATGAGLTIPFINLFFKSVYGMETKIISFWNFIAAFFVAFVALLVPRIKETIGYRIAIPTTQFFAVLALILLATTELYSHIPIAVAIAVGSYVLRQPLMNLAGPMTSEIALKFVGKKNREFTSAIMAAIWSGSWFLGIRFIFGTLSKRGWPFVNIFLTTAALYLFGILLYIFLIRAYGKRKEKGLIEE
ncbi:MAG: MFS transporter [Bacteroidetes bacterium]|nr:MFS transporter [Bacteroidota bacterium]